MKLPSASAPGWILHVHRDLRYKGTLEYVFRDGIVCKVSLTAALTSLLLALAVCREIDERNGVTHKVGCRSFEKLGRIVGRMFKPGNVVLGGTIGNNRGRITSRIRKAFKQRSEEIGYPLPFRDPVFHGDRDDGYCLVDEGLMLIGVTLDELIERVIAKQR
jgi:hypothetical protein